MAFDKFSTIFFWYLFGMCAWWFIFYKFQNNIYIYFPQNESIYASQYQGLLITLVACKFLSLAYKIYFEQSVMDIFFIDWESPKSYLINNNTKRVTSVSPWRRLFLANEFSELQAQKHINSELVLLFFLVLIEGFGLKNYALLEPNASLTNDGSQRNYPLNFFMIVCIVFGLGFF